MKRTKFFFAAICILLVALCSPAKGWSQASTAKSDCGEIIHLNNFNSEYVTPRNVDIWLPNGYSDAAEKYSVLYMHDGQMLFDPSITWNGQAWEADNVADKLMQEERISKTIIVGIWNAGIERHADYFPQAPFENMSDTERDSVNAQLERAANSKFTFQPNSDNYLRFIVEELKPYIDQHLHVYTDRKHTYIAGSSMGGLISMYAICEYPGVFGGAACLSTHWIGSYSDQDNPLPQAIIDYMAESLPSPKKNRFYFDCGDQTLDAMYPPYQKEVDALMESKGFDGRNWMTKYFPGQDHTEKSWNSRLEIPLEFLIIY